MTGTATDTHDLLTPSQRQIVYGWNDTARPYSLEQCLHTLVEATAIRTPDAPAVVFDNDPAGDDIPVSDAPTLTYAELDACANRLAHQLRRYGVGPDVPVGLCAERSLEMVVGILGILKAGGVYMPLDPSLPAERLSFMLADTRPPVVVVQPHLAERLPPDDIPHLLLDLALLDEGPAEPLAPPQPDHLAYIIYTSGSTGNPKGVGVSHRSIVNRMLWMLDTYHMDAGDRLLQKTPYSFDVSVWEFFWPLLVGATLVMARSDGHKDPDYLANVIARQQITTIHFVPSLLSIFLETSDLSRCATLRHVFCSGEALPLGLQQRFFARFSIPLYNLYGPTEAAVEVTAWTCDPASTHASVPIGMPIANTQMYVLDASFAPLPVGEAGELYIGGVQLARGYMGRPELTAERFIPNPYPTDARFTTRLYRTGDIARYAADGSIEYLGRTDGQVKVGGVRIELGEIEAAIALAPNVRDAVVLAPTNHVGERQLIGYIVLANADIEGRSTDIQPSSLVANLRAYLEERLPVYMVPAAFVLLDTMPTNSNGKADRKALAALDWTKASRRTAYVAPETPLEEALAAIWQESFGYHQIGIHDAFFDLGGNSLRATQIVSRVRQAFQNPLTVRDLLAVRTISRLADHLLATDPQPGRTEKIALALRRLRTMSADERHRTLQQHKEH